MTSTAASMMLATVMMSAMTPVMVNDQYFSRTKKIK